MRLGQRDPRLHRDLAHVPVISSEAELFAAPAVFDDLPRIRSGHSLVDDDRRRGAELRCDRSEEHTSELQSLMRISYAVFCLKKKNQQRTRNNTDTRSYLIYIQI